QSLMGPVLFATPATSPLGTNVSHVHSVDRRAWLPVTDQRLTGPSRDVNASVRPSGANQMVWIQLGGVTFGCVVRSVAVGISHSSTAPDPHPAASTRPSGEMAIEAIPDCPISVILLRCWKDGMSQRITLPPPR